MDLNRSRTVIDLSKTYCYRTSDLPFQRSLMLGWTENDTLSHFTIPRHHINTTFAWSERISVKQTFYQRSTSHLLSDQLSDSYLKTLANLCGTS